MRRRTLWSVRIVEVGFFCAVLALASAQTRHEAKDAAKSAIKAFFPTGTKVATPSAKLLANLQDRRIHESSGLAASQRNPNVLWTHNDSGDGPYLFAIDRQGRTLARYSVEGATNVDWEDIALGPGRFGRPALYIGDIGDNSSNRDDTAFYRVTEPIVNLTATMREAKSASAEKYPYRYPDGHHDAETLLVHPTTGAIYVVTKEGDGHSGLYAYPMPLKPGETATLQKVGALTFHNTFFRGNGLYGKGERMATGGAISPDGRRVTVRTYMLGYEWTIAPGQSVPDAMRSKPREVMLPLTRQGESITYRPDGKALLMTSEKLPTPLYEMPL